MVDKKKIPTTNHGAHCTHGSKTSTPATDLIHSGAWILNREREQQIISRFTDNLFKERKRQIQSQRLKNSKNK